MTMNTSLEWLLTFSGLAITEIALLYAAFVRRAVSSLAIAAFLASTVIFILVLVAYFGFSGPVSQVAVMLAGATAMASLVSLSTYLTQVRPYRKMATMKFNEPFVKVTISHLLSVPENEVNRTKRELQKENMPWDLTPSYLLNVDTPLALARLRMDIEAELRKLAFRAGLEVHDHPSNWLSISRTLADQGVIPSQLLDILRDIMTVCNAAIHGQDVSKKDAAAVVRTGEELLSRLRVKYGGYGRNINDWEITSP